MLIDIDTGERIDRIPHFRDFNTLRDRLNQYHPDAFDAIVDHINELIDNAGAEIATAGWLPGDDWGNTPLQPLYEVAARHNYEVAGMMFGLMVWYTVMHRPEQWASGRFERDGVPIGSRTYFRVEVP